MKRKETKECERRRVKERRRQKGDNDHAVTS